ncbi:arylamine N-acetyltransferase [Streptomyces sp. NPDC048277]|uniref:arylamine N-acetyltransferase family protein n=1 Tax=Streptomyces sp. NPDC048277 TaxID=3155027 RepID=UPI0033CBB0BF
MHGTEDAHGLGHLQERHVLSVPFEMIAFYTGEPVGHSMDAVRKVVDHHRGGSCFELNSAFGLLLRALGYEVEIIWGRIHRDTAFDKRTGHMALRVRTPGSPVPWLVDVGHGYNSRRPLRLDLRTPQDDPHGTYLLTPAEEGDVDVSVDGRTLYRMESRARDEDYGEAMMWWYHTSPKSPFKKKPVCMQPTETGKYSLLGTRFTSEEDGSETVRDIETEAELIEIYKRCFGIELSTLPVRSADLPSPAPGLT